GCRHERDLIAGGEEGLEAEERHDLVVVRLCRREVGDIDSDVAKHPRSLPSSSMGRPHPAFGAWRGMRGTGHCPTPPDRRERGGRRIAEARSYARRSAQGAPCPREGLSPP